MGGLANQAIYEVAGQLATPLLFCYIAKAGPITRTSRVTENTLSNPFTDRNMPAPITLEE